MAVGTKGARTRDEPVDFTADDVRLIAASLPAGITSQRLALLPLILREWGRTELPGIMARRGRDQGGQQLAALKDAAGKLANAMATLGDYPRKRIAKEFARGPDGLLMLVTKPELTAGELRLNVVQEQVNDLVEAVSRAVPSERRGRPRNSVGTSVMTDLAAIFEFLTDMRATRQVDRETSKECGPFWHFASTVWRIVFRHGESGPTAAIKRWARGTREFDSSLIADLAGRHPAWKIFD